MHEHGIPLESCFACSTLGLRNLNEADKSEKMLRHHDNVKHRSVPSNYTFVELIFVDTSADNLSLLLAWMLCCHNLFCNQSTCVDLWIAFSDRIKSSKMVRSLFNVYSLVMTSHTCNQQSGFRVSSTWSVMKNRNKIPNSIEPPTHASLTFSWESRESLRNLLFMLIDPSLTATVN